MKQTKFSSAASRCALAATLALASVGSWAATAAEYTTHHPPAAASAASAAADADTTP